MKKAKILVLVLALALCVVGMVGCKTQNNTPPVTYTVEIDKYAVEMNILDDLTLNATTDQEGATISWSSSDTAVATVNDGVITPISVGSTVITAYTDKAQAECYLTVVNQNILPVLSVSEESVRLLIDDEFALETSVEYKGQPANGATVTYSSSDENVARVDANGKIVATGKGSATITVVGAWKNVEQSYLTETVTVNVVNNVSFAFSAQSVSIWAIESLEGQTYDNTANVTVTALDYQTPITSGLTVTVSDPSICTYSNGVITGLKAGKTTLVASLAEYEGDSYSDSIEIEVKAPLVEKDIEFRLSRLNADVSGIFTDSLAPVKVVKYGDPNKEYTVTNGKIDNAADFTTNDIVKIAVYNEKYGYIIDGVEVLDLLVKDANDLAILRSATSGYFELANDIDMLGKSLPATSGTFSGTLDGKGYSIKNAYFSSDVNNGLFYNLSGTIKNIGFVDASLKGHGAVVCTTLGATAVIDNVYVGVANLMTIGSAGLARNIWNTTAVITNTVICVKAVTPTDAYTHVYMDGSSDTGLKVGMLAFDFVVGIDCSTVKFVTDVTNLLPLSVTSNTTYTESTARQAFLDNNKVIGIWAFRNGVTDNTISVMNKDLALAISDDGVIRISNASDLLAIRNVTSGHYVLTTDINMSGVTINTAATTNFGGVLDGNGHTVSNITLTGAANGFFKKLAGTNDAPATIKNIAFKDLTTSSSVQGGGLALEIGTSVVIDNLYLSASIKSNGSGALCKNCWSTTSSTAKIAVTNSLIYVTSSVADWNSGAGYNGAMGFAFDSGSTATSKVNVNTTGTKVITDKFSHAWGSQSGGNITLRADVATSLETLLADIEANKTTFAYNNLAYAIMDVKI